MAPARQHASALAVLLFVISSQLGSTAQSSHPTRDVATEGALFGGSVAVTTRQGLDALEKPVFVVFYPDRSEGQTGRIAAMWRELAAWALEERLQSAAAAVPESDIASQDNHPGVECHSASGRLVRHSGPFEMDELKLFVAQECCSISLPVKSFLTLEKYSRNPTGHDIAYNRMVQQLTTQNFRARTRERGAVVITSSAMCALCKILRPSYNSLRKEPALSKVAILHVEGDAAKESPIGGYIGDTAPTVLFLRNGEVTGKFDVKAGKDTAAYAWELVAWAVRQNLLPLSCIAAAKAKQQALLVASSNPEGKKLPTETFQLLFPPFTEERMRQQADSEGLLVVYHTAICWQCSGTLINMWNRLADGGMAIARSEMVFPSRAPHPLGSHLCTAPFCILYWRGGVPTSRFTGTVDAASLWQFWNSLLHLDRAKAAELAQRLNDGGVAGGGGGDALPTTKLEQEARVVQRLNQKELQRRAKRAP
eukprot:CAMPEP_0117656994 /NCGR_PEP_ID=MMETSP0804-20121206/5097_1 /TAXON_ID=1074897 /ORGANISM="Tetraselmis astigmatica, Strain CCMP880" /LENGTH=479 /DNA_ID=CAMNT_0005463425 /DNA_START=83 /DNA_END=1519 /DNA_ORIENTATION=-